MRSIITILFLLNSVLLFGSSADSVHVANKHYENGEFESALSIYTRILENEKAGADLLYNIGNCFYKLGDIPNAILHYERALKLDPFDEDIAFNLEMANLKVISKLEENPSYGIDKFKADVLSSLSLRTATSLSIAFIWICFGLSCIYIFSSRRNLRKLSFYSGVFFLFLFFISFFFVLAKQQYLNNSNEAILMSTNSYVKSAPDNSSTDLFILHGGVKLEIVDESKDWYKIRIPDGKVGWLESRSVEKI